MTREKLAIDSKVVEQLNEMLLDSRNEIVNGVHEVIEKYGTPEQIKAKAKEAGSFDSLFSRTASRNPDYVKDLEWLIEQRDKNAFVFHEEFIEKISSRSISIKELDYSCAPILEISALQYFPWIIEECRRSIEKGRYCQEDSSGSET